MRSAPGRPWWRRRWFIVLVSLLIVIAASAAYIVSLPQFGAKLSGDRLTRAKANAQYRDGAFFNRMTPASYQSSDLWEMFSRQFFGDEVRVPPSPIPVLPVTAETLSNLRSTTGLRAFWIGHGSAYAEIDGVSMLIDPVFSDYASPMDVGPKRFHPPPIALSALPPIDAVLITHDHYDHLDMKTVQHLAGKGTTFFVPLGIGAHLQAWGVPEAQIRDMEWWQEQPIKGVKIISTPSQHYSGRALRDKNATLWGSWSVIGSRHRFYVSGDTGYAEHFRAIGEKFGPFDLAFIKIGAYGPGAPWAQIHMGAEDAVRASREVRAKRMFPVHWSTFNLAFHAWDEPIRRALTAARANQVELLTPRIGEIVDADQPFPVNAWWESVR